jgi:hypothetical protein
MGMKNLSRERKPRVSIGGGMPCSGQRHGASRLGWVMFLIDFFRLAKVKA